MATSTELVSIWNAIKDDLVELNFWGNRIEFAEDEDAVPDFPIVLPCALIHPVETTYENKTGAQSDMIMNVGITILADLTERDWTLVGGMSGGLDLANMLYQIREKYKRTTLGGLVHVGNVVSQGKPQRAIYDNGEEEQTVFRITSVLQIINYQAG